MPVKGVACGLPRGNPFNVPCRSLVAIVPDAPDVPDPLLLLAIVVDEVLVERQRIADNVSGTPAAS
ncbi:hypothetical protein LA04_08710 [Enterobacter sp. UCD-UG_FMILLET]|nr:hypothetical protein LA04_08710 [Enterobacter sp. UCD-UG_FMILLET]